MNIALLHATAWPNYGSAENLMRDQALLLHRRGHNVTVITGYGEDPLLGFNFVKIEQLSPHFPLAKSVRAVLDNGQFDQSYTKYRNEIAERLAPVLKGIDFTIVHDHFTSHFNLALTQALHDLSGQHKFIAWTHRVAATGLDYAVPNPTKVPWALMRQTAPNVTYIVPSETRATELRQHLKPVVEPTIIPHAMELAFLYRLTPEMQASLEALSLPDRDYIFLCPARALPRKNLDQTILFVTKVRELGKNPLLLLTASPDDNTPAGAQYGDFLRATLPVDLQPHVIFVSDHIPITDEILLNLYQLSDAVLYLPRLSGFGLPVLEACLHRLPVICSQSPAAQILGYDGVFLFEKVEQVPVVLDWLEAQIGFRMKRRARKRLDIDLLYSAYYEPLFQRVAGTK